MEDDVGNKTVLEVLEEGEREVKVTPVPFCLMCRHRRSNEHQS
jgi:hypothetical protein